MLKEDTPLRVTTSYTRSTSPPALGGLPPCLQPAADAPPRRMPLPEGQQCEGQGHRGKPGRREHVEGQIVERRLQHEGVGRRT